MAAGTYAPEAPGSRSAGPSNPALSPESFRRGWALAAPNERVGMTVGGTYFKTAVLLVILFFGASFGWSQVQIVEVRGVPVALQPAWTWLVAFGTLFLGIVAAV